MLSCFILLLELFVPISFNQNSHFVHYSTKIKFEFCKHLIVSRINYDRNENRDLQVVYIVLLLVFAYWNFSFSIPSVFEAFLLSMLHCCLMDDDLEFYLVMELIMLVAVKKNGFSKIWNFIIKLTSGKKQPLNIVFWEHLMDSF